VRMLVRFDGAARVRVLVLRRGALMGVFGGQRPALVPGPMRMLVRVLVAVRVRMLMGMHQVAVPMLVGMGVSMSMSMSVGMLVRLVWFHSLVAPTYTVKFPPSNGGPARKAPEA
jgi:hypothetical protein